MLGWGDVKELLLAAGEGQREVLFRSPPGHLNRVPEFLGRNALRRRLESNLVPVQVLVINLPHGILNCRRLQPGNGFCQLPTASGEELPEFGWTGWDSH